MSKPIVVGYDPRRLDRAPVDFSVAVARATGAPVIVAAVQATTPVVPIPAGQSQPYGLLDADLVADCTPALEQLEAELEPLGIGVDCVKLESTSAARALQAAAEAHNAGLLVVGPHERSAVGTVLAGSTAQRLLHGAPCPVAVVPRSWTADGGFMTIGVAYVDSEEGREALRSAHALARRVGAKLRVVTVIKEELSMVAETETYKAGQLPKDLEDVEGEHKVRAEEHLRRTVAELGAEVRVEVDAMVGDPAESIVGVSEHVDLLVCGSRGYGPLRSVLLGSVSRRVVAEARCPVIVVPRGIRVSLEALGAEASGAAAPV
jgi:nucleotide-binding universal stress UspA family protein